MTPLSIAAALALAVGLAVMAVGARLESRGRLAPARRLGRWGGFAALAGSLASAALAPSIPVAILALAAGTIAVLGGLAGKPRPSWWVAAIALGLAIAAALDA